MICTLVELRLNDGSGGFNIIRLATSPFDVILNTDVYIGSGDLLDISDTETTNEISKSGLTVALGGIDISYQAELDSDGFIRAPIDILIAEVPDNSNVVSTYTYYHRGYCDTPATKVDYKAGNITLSVETTNVFTDIDRKPDLLRCSVASHSSRHPGDKFFEFTADVDIDEVWKD